MNYKKINLDSWNRKEHFEFFSKMKSPFFGFTSEVDCSICYENCKKENRSFFATYLFYSMQAYNQVRELKFRILENEVVEFDCIHIGTTIGRADGTFGFAYVPFTSDYDEFNRKLQQEIEAVQNSSGLRLDNEDLNVDLVRHTSIPWHHFNGVLHPTNFNSEDSVPKIVFGRFEIREGKKMLPVAIEAHHGLCDGIHLSNYLDELQRLLNESEK